MAKPNFPLSWVALVGVSCAALSVPTYGDDSAQSPLRWKCKWCAIDDQKGLSGSVTVGVGALSDDSYRFDEYLGYGNNEVLADLGLQLSYWGEDGFWASLEGTNLGFDSRSTTFEVGDIGHFQFRFEYDELMQRTLSAGLSPYGLQGDAAILPADWVPAPSTFLMQDLDRSLREVSLETKRKRLSFSGKYQTPVKNILLDFSSSQEKKAGRYGASGAFGNENAFSTLAAQFAAPLDQKTANLDFGVQYKFTAGSVRLGYNLSLFSQDVDSVIWENAFEDNFENNQFGQSATAPDNEFHQLSLSGNARLAAKTHLSGYYNVGEMTQDEDFLDYTTNIGFNNALPVASLEGKVSTLQAGLGLISSPFKDWRFAANYKLDERDNETDRYAYDYIVLDSAESAIFRANSPYSYSKQKASFKTSYRVARSAKVSAGLNYAEEERTYQEVSDIDETVRWVAANTKVLPGLTAKIRAEQFDRRGDGYEERVEIIPSENPLLRKYNLADSEGERTKLDFFHAPLDSVSLAFSLENRSTDYHNTEIGLTAKESKIATFDVNYFPVERLSSYAFYSVEMLAFEQAGSQTGGESDWQNTVTDELDTVGLGFSYLTKDKQLEYGVDYLYSDATEKSKLVTALEFADVLPSSENKLETVTAFYQREINANYQVKVDLIYEVFREKDYQYSEIEPDSSSSVLAFGDGDADYEVWSVMINNTYRF